MTENTGDTGGVVDRRSAKRRRRSLNELVAIVRPPGRPTEIRAFTRDQLDEAEAYAADMDADVEVLPE